TISRNFRTMLSFESLIPIRHLLPITSTGAHRVADQREVGLTFCAVTDHARIRSRTTDEMTARSRRCAALRAVVRVLDTGVDLYQRVRAFRDVEQTTSSHVELTLKSNHRGRWRLVCATAPRVPQSVSARQVVFACARNGVEHVANPQGVTEGRVTGVLAGRLDTQTTRDVLGPPGHDLLTEQVEAGGGHGDDVYRPVVPGGRAVEQLLEKRGVEPGIGPDHDRPVEQPPDPLLYRHQRQGKPLVRGDVDAAGVVSVRDDEPVVVAADLQGLRVGLVQVGPNLVQDLRLVARSGVSPDDGEFPDVVSGVRVEPGRFGVGE